MRAPVRRTATVTGRVQGVSFRYHAERQAEQRDLVGWVRNEPDGSVRLEVQGPDEDVADFLRWVHTGPPHADVEDVRTSDVEPRDDETDFRTVS